MKVRLTCKMCRRSGEKLCDSPKCAIVRRKYPPGAHGPKGYPRLTGYGLRLVAKQKLRWMYGLTEKQFRNLFKRATKEKGDSGDNLLKLLESRLDNIIYRLGLAVSRSQARQLVNHGHFLVNDKKVNIPSYLVQSSDEIKIKSGKENSQYFKDAFVLSEKSEKPSWLSWDKNEKVAKVIGEPDVESIKQKVDPRLIVEYYSK